MLDHSSLEELLLSITCTILGDHKRDDRGEKSRNVFGRRANTQGKLHRICIGDTWPRSPMLKNGQLLALWQIQPLGRLMLEKLSGAGPRSIQVKREKEAPPTPPIKALSVSKRLIIWASSGPL